MLFVKSCAFACPPLTLQWFLESLQTILEKGIPHIERTAAPVFPIIVETSRTSYDEWTIITYTSQAVDAIMEGTMFVVEVRTRTTNGFTTYKRAY